MADTNAAKKPCAGLQGGALKESCESTHAECGSSPGGAVTCEQAVSFCATNDGWPATFVTEKGNFAPNDAGQCFGILNFFRDNGYEVQGITGSKPSAPAAPAPPQPKAKPPPEKKPGDTKPAAGKAGEATHSTVESSAAPTGEGENSCGMAGNEKAQSSCMEIVDACAANATWPFVLETTGGKFKPNDREQCMALATTLASIGYSLGSAQEASNQSQTWASGSPGGTSSSQAHDDENPTSSAKGASIVKSFYDVNLGLRVTNGEFITEKRVLHFAGGKGIKLTLEYKIEQLSAGRYLMEYRIYRKDEELGGSQSISFSANDGKMNLGFQITLADENDYGSINSISIVEI